MSRSMKKYCFSVTVLMVLLIFYSRQVISAAAEGVQLCIRTAIPSLFPFFVLSGILVPGISTIRIPALQKLLKVPFGWESVFLLSAVGGYPIGAQCIAQGYKAKQLSKAQAQRMLGFCNNCGPSFLFGVVAPFFPNPGYAAVLMVISVLSAIFVGLLWKEGEVTCSDVPEITPVTLPKAVKQALTSMANVCTWIVLGKIAVLFLNRFIPQSLPVSIKITLTGLLELTNGCLALGKIDDLTIRFLVAAIMIPFGGVCVAMQISSICAEADLSVQNYIPQKLMQACISFLLAWIFIVQNIPAAVIMVIIPVLYYLLKTAVAFSDRMIYNKGNKGGFHHAVPKEN